MNKQMAEKYKMGAKLMVLVRKGAPYEKNYKDVILLIT